MHLTWIAFLLGLLQSSLISASAMDFANPGLVSRKLASRASDPCCNSCSLLGKVESECATSPDVFCGCGQWVAGAPSCQACVVNAEFQSAFSADEGTLLGIEWFWALCQCSNQCRTFAQAQFTPNPCQGGSNHTCVSQVLVKDGPACAGCLFFVDRWFASYFSIWIAQAQKFLKTGSSPVPGMSSFHVSNC
jgi:hypothetical protein